MDDQSESNDVVKVSREQWEDCQRKVQLWEQMRETVDDDGETLEREHEIEKLRKENEDNQRTLEELRQENNRLKETDETKLQAQLYEADTERARLKNQVITLEKETQNLKIEKQSLLDRNHFLQSANDKLMKETMKYSEQYLKLCEQIGDYQQQNTELKVTNEHLSATKQNWEDQLNAKNKMIEWYKGQLDAGDKALMMEVQNRASKVEELMDAIRSQSKKLEAANVEFEKARADLETQEKLVALHAQKSQDLSLKLQHERSEHETEVRALKSSSNLLTKHFDQERDDLISRLSKESDISVKLKNKLRDARDEKHNLENEVTCLQRERETLSQEMRKLQESLESAKRNSVEFLLQNVDGSHADSAENMDLQKTRMFREVHNQKEFIAKLQKELGQYGKSLKETRELHEKAQLDCDQYKLNADFLQKQNDKLSEEIETLRHMDHEWRQNTQTLKAHYDHILEQNNRLRSEIAGYMYGDGGGERSKKQIEDILEDNERQKEDAEVWKTRCEEQEREFEKQIDLAIKDMDGLRGREEKWKARCEQLESKFERLVQTNELDAIEAGSTAENIELAAEKQAEAPVAAAAAPAVLYADAHLEEQFLKFRRRMDSELKEKENEIAKLEKEVNKERLEVCKIEIELQKKELELQNKQGELDQARVGTQKVQENLLNAHAETKRAQEEVSKYVNANASLEVDITRLKRQLETAGVGGERLTSAASEDRSKQFQLMLKGQVESFKKVVTDDQKKLMQQKETQYIQAMKQISMLEIDVNNARKNAEIQLESVNLELKNYRNKLEEEEKKVRRLEDDKKIREKHYKEQALQLKEVIERIQNSSRIATSVRSFEVENHMLKKQNEQFKTNISKIQTEYEQYIKKHQGDHDAMTKELETLKSNHKVVRGKLQKAEEKIKENTESTSVYDARIKSLKESAEQLKSRNTELEKLKPVLEKQAKALRVQLEQAKASLNKSEGERDQWKKKAEEAEPQLTKMQKERDDAVQEKTRLVQAGRNRGQLQMKITSLKRENEQLKQQVEELQKRPAAVSTSEASQQEPDFRVKSLHADKEELLKKNTHISEELKRKEVQIEQHVQKIKDLEERVELLVKQNDSLEKQRQVKITGGLKQYNAQRKECEESSALEPADAARSVNDDSLRADLERKIIELQKKISEKDTTIDGIQSKLISLQANAKASKEQINQYKANLARTKADHKQEMLTKKTEIESLTRKSNTFQKKFITAEKKNVSMEKNHTKLKSQLADAQQQAVENKQNADQSKELRQLRTQIRVLKNSNANIQKEREAALKRYDDNLKKLIGEFQAHMKQVGEWQQDNNSPLEGVQPKERLATHINRMATTLTRLKQVVQKQKSEINKHVQTQAANEGLQRKVKELESNLSERVAEIERLKKEQSTQVKNAALMANQTSRMKTELEEKRKEAAELLVENKNVEADMTSMEENVEKLQKEIESMRSESVALKLKQNNALEERQNRINELEAALKDAESNIQSGDQRLQDVTSDKDAELELVRKEVATLQEAVSMLQADLERNGKELKAKDAMLKDQIDLLVKKDEMLKQKEDQFNAIKQNNEQLIMQRDELKEQYEQLQRDQSEQQYEEEDILAPTQAIPTSGDEGSRPVNFAATAPPSRKRSHPDDNEDEESRKRRKLNETIADDEVVQEPQLGHEDYQQPAQYSMDEDPPISRLDRNRDNEIMSNCATVADEDVRTQGGSTIIHGDTTSVHPPGRSSDPERSVPSSGLEEEVDPEEEMTDVEDDDEEHQEATEDLQEDPEESSEQDEDDLQFFVPASGTQQDLDAEENEAEDTEFDEDGIEEPSISEREAEGDGDHGEEEEVIEEADEEVDDAEETEPADIVAVPLTDENGQRFLSEGEEEEQEEVLEDPEATQEEEAPEADIKYLSEDEKPA